MPIDFDALRRKSALKRQEDKAKIGLPVIKDSPKPSDDEFHKGMTEDEAIGELLANGENVSDWERNFLNSIRTWMRSTNYNGLSIKQKTVFEKICRNNNLHIEASKIPTRDNRYASNEYIPPNGNGNSAPVGIDKLFDSYEDDDIHF